MSERFPPDAILLAAGLGTRLRPLTLARPKPLVCVAGVPLIEWVIACLTCEGVTRFAVNAHYLAEQMEAAIADLPARFPGATFRLSREKAQLRDTGGGAKAALGLVETDPVLIANTDAFWPAGQDAPLARMSAVFKDHPGAVILLCAYPSRTLGFRRSHDFFLDPNGAIDTETGLPVIFAGVALVGRAWFADMPEGAFSMNRIFEQAHKQKRLRGVLLEADWFHIGDPEALAEAELRLREG